MITGFLDSLPEDLARNATITPAGVARVLWAVGLSVAALILLLR